MRGPTRILVVDDERNISDLVAMALRYEGFTVAPAATAREAHDAVTHFWPALVIVDIGLPDKDGSSLVKRFRAEGHTVPVIFLTVRDAPEENVSGLAGDDYVMKPFSLEHLTARIRVVLRRQPGGPA